MSAEQSLSLGAILPKYLTPHSQFTPSMFVWNPKPKKNNNNKNSHWFAFQQVFFFFSHFRSEGMDGILSFHSCSSITYWWQCHHKGLTVAVHFIISPWTVRFTITLPHLRYTATIPTITFVLIPGAGQVRTVCCWTQKTERKKQLFKPGMYF